MAAEAKARGFSPRALASAAMPSRTNAGSSATTFGSVMLSVNALVAASAFCPNRSVSPESSEVYLR